MQLKQKTRETGSFIISLIKCTSPLLFTDREKCDPINVLILNEIKKNALVPGSLTMPERAYLTGKMLYLVGGCFVGVTELKAGLSALNVAKYLKRITTYASKINTIINVFTKVNRSIKKTVTGIALYVKLNATDVTFATINKVDKVLTIQVPAYIPSTGGNVIETFTQDLVKFGNQTYNNKTIEIINDNGVLKHRLKGAGDVFKIGDKIAGITVMQVRIGSTNKIVIIGRQMRNHVYKVAEALTLNGKYVEVLDDSYLKPLYNEGYEFIIDGKKWTVKSAWDDMVNNPKWLPFKDSEGFIKLEHLNKTPMFKLNNMWIKKAKLEGATIINIGYPNNHDMSISGFYEMEKAIINWD